MMQPFFYKSLKQASLIRPDPPSVYIYIHIYKRLLRLALRPGKLRRRLKEAQLPGRSRDLLNYLEETRTN